mmetsp:Transcript_104/g.365  ORF Transcript_104/g.365 Transcript_104/m.365 type:complete len:246 (+) Transcript_104:610-1347(+)
MVVAQPRAVHPNVDRKLKLRRIRRREPALEVLDCRVNGLLVEAQVRVVVAQRVQALPQLLRTQRRAARTTSSHKPEQALHHVAIAQGHAATCVLLHQRLARRFLRLDFALHLRARLARRLADLRRRLHDERVVEHVQHASLLEARVHSLQRLHELKLEKLPNILILRIHEQVHQLAVLAAHLLGVQHLVPPTHLKCALEERRVVGEVAVRDELLPGAVVRRNEKAAENRAHLHQLLLHALRLPAV